MAEILFKAIDATNPDPDKDRRGCYKKGYPVVVIQDGHTWGTEEALPKFIIVKCTEVTVEQCKQYIESWNDNFSYTVVSQDAAKGIYTVRVQNDTANVSGLNRITLAKVEAFLTKWGCTGISFTSPYVQFTFKLWDVVRSDGFWGKENIDDFASFVLNSYNATTGIAVVTATVSNISENAILFRIKTRGGTLISHTGSVYQFSIERSAIFELFKAEVKSKMERTYCVRKFYISEADVDTVVNAGGVVTLTKTQLLNKLKNKLTE